MFKKTNVHLTKKECGKILHTLLDPLRDIGFLSQDRHLEIYTELDQFLDAVRGDGLEGEVYWEHFQKLFEFANVVPLITPMNAANLCPEPKSLLQIANTLRLEYNRNVAQQMRTGNGERVQQLREARKLLAEGLGIADVTELAIVRNASEANNAINCGYQGWHETTNLHEKDNVVLWAENHPTNLDAWQMRAGWRFPYSVGDSKFPLFEIRTVSFNKNASDEDISKEFIENIDQKTRFVSYSETANSTGFRIPESVIQKIWNHVTTNTTNCHVHIDGTMAWGARPVNLANPLCHSFASSGHKWFLGPKETGILYINRKAQAQYFQPSILGYDYEIKSWDWRDLPPHAGRFELLGQRDDVNIIALAFTQMMWNVLKPRDPHGRVASLGQYLISKLQPDWKIITPEAPERSWGVIRMEAPQAERRKSLYDWLYDGSYQGLRIAGSGDDKTFRLCPHIYNTKSDINRAVAGMNAWLTSI